MCRSSLSSHGAPSLIARSCLLVLALLTTACGRPSDPDAEVRHFVVGVSPLLSAGEAERAERFIHRLMLEAIPSGSDVEIHDAFNLRRITAFSLPEGRALDSTKIRMKLLGAQVAAVRRFFADAAERRDLASGVAALRLPGFLEAIAASRTEPQQPLTVVLLGTALYVDPRVPGFSMAGGLVPTLDHLCAGIEESPFGVAGKKGRLADVHLHFGVLDTSWLNDLHRQAVRDLWSLYAQEQGGWLTSFTGDLDVLAERAVGEDLRPAESFSVRCGQPLRLAMYRPERPRPGSSAATTPLFSSPCAEGGVALSLEKVRPVWIGIQWNCRECDLDLYSRAAPGAEELSHQDDHSEFGHHRKDFDAAAVHGFEQVIYGKAVDWRQLEAAVHFSNGRSPAKVKGEVRVRIGTRVYCDGFEIEATEGRKVAESGPRRESPNWAILDLPSLLRPVEPPAPTISGAVGPRRARAVTNPSPRREVRILDPRDGETLVKSRYYSGNYRHDISGDVRYFEKEEIRKLGLRVEVSIYTDRWHVQGEASVRSDRTWAVRQAFFAGAKHLIRATLMDRHGNVVDAHEIAVTVIRE
ncbi:MAG: hypothetical protein MI919_05190 [Holophagales bacterium]|nr:hypothetical protein [Holophagales bacterium]